MPSPAKLSLVGLGEKMCLEGTSEFIIQTKVAYASFVGMWIWMYLQYKVLTVSWSANWLLTNCCECVDAA